MKQLVDFKRITLAPGETKNVTFTLHPDQFAIWNIKMKRVIEPGKFDIMVGSSSADIQLRGTVTEK
jgi:beta-glucosidase